MITSSIDVLHTARSLADQLGDSWRAATSEFGADAAELIGPGQQRVLLTAHRQRWYVNGIYPTHRHGTPYEIERPKISVATSRGMHTLAAEISRRLLPPYAVLLKRVLEHQAECERREQARDQLTARILATLPGSHRLSWDTARIVSSGCGLNAVDVRISNDATQITELGLRRLPVETALRVLALIAAETGEEPGG